MLGEVHAVVHGLPRHLSRRFRWLSTRLRNHGVSVIE